MRITTESPDSGEGFDEVPIEYAGPNMTIGFNAKYFLDVLGALDEDEVELGLRRGARSCRGEARGPAGSFSPS